MNYLSVLSQTKSDSMVLFEKSPIFEETDLLFRSFSFYQLIESVRGILFEKKYIDGLLSDLKNIENPVDESANEFIFENIGDTLGYIRVFIDEFSIESKDSKVDLSYTRGSLYTELNDLLTRLDKVFVSDKNQGVNYGNAVDMYKTKYEKNISIIQNFINSFSSEQVENMRFDFNGSLDKMLYAVTSLNDLAMDEYLYLLNWKGYSAEELSDVKSEVDKKLKSDEFKDSLPKLEKYAKDVLDSSKELDKLFSKYEFVKGEKIPLVELCIYYFSYTNTELLKKYGLSPQSV